MRSEKFDAITGSLLIAAISHYGIDRDHSHDQHRSLRYVVMDYAHPIMECATHTRRGTTVSDEQIVQYEQQIDLLAQFVAAHITARGVERIRWYERGYGCQKNNRIYDLVTYVYNTYVKNGK